MGGKTELNVVVVVDESVVVLSKGFLVSPGKLSVELIAQTGFKFGVCWSLLCSGRPFSGVHAPIP